MTCEICTRLEQAERGEHPGVIARFTHGIAVLGDNQGCPGWCVLLLRAHVEHLAEMSVEHQQAIFGEVARVAGAIRRVFATSGAGGGPVRINYECLGNQVAHVHWHVIPRHADDPAPRLPIWGWDPARLRGEMSETARRHLVAQLRACFE